MKKIMKIVAKNLWNFSTTAKQKSAFCNISEGTHAGRLTCVAKADIDKAYLLVKFENGGIVPASLGDAPVGVCTDSGEIGDVLDIALAGCAESSILCVSANEVAAGKALYSAANGSVSTTASAGSVKIGIALSAAPAGGIVEVDPQGFGTSASMIVASGVHSWNGTASANTCPFGSAKNTDKLIASISSSAAAEQLVSANVNASGNFDFNLSKAGAAATKITWILIRES